MKRKLHINDFFFQAVARGMRAAGRVAEAEVFESLDPTKWTWGYINSNVYGSAGNPCKTADNKITAYNMTVARSLWYKNGVKTGNAAHTLHTIALIPKELRPKYLGDLTAAQNTGKITPEMLGLDLSKPGCYYHSVGTSSARFVVVVGSDQNVVSHADVMSYMPFDMPVGSWNGGLVPKDAVTMGYSASGYSGVANNRVVQVDLIVYKGTVPAPVPKELNPNLPNWTPIDFENKAPKGYTTIPLQTLTFDWAAMANKYTSKVHLNRVFLDLVINALETAGDTATADKVRTVDPKTFIPWLTTVDTANKKTTLKGARCSTAKLWFESIQYNNYLDKANTFSTDFNFMYTAESGMKWSLVVDAAAMAASSLNTLLGAITPGTFGIHKPKPYLINTPIVNSDLPFSIEGMPWVQNDFNVATTGAVSVYNTNCHPIWMGPNSLKITYYADRT